MLVTDVGGDNLHSQRNLERAGFSRCDPEQPWGPPGSVYFRKSLEFPLDGLRKPSLGACATT